MEVRIPIVYPCVSGIKLPNEKLSSAHTWWPPKATFYTKEISVGSVTPEIKAAEDHVTSFASWA